MSKENKFRSNNTVVSPFPLVKGGRDTCFIEVVAPAMLAGWPNLSSFADMAGLPWTVLPTTTNMSTYHDHQHSYEVLSGSMKLADLIDLNYGLIKVLARFGLKLGFGEETVEEACRKNGIDPDTFLLISYVYTFDSNTVPRDLVRRVDLRAVVSYLHQSHSYYMGYTLALLEDALCKVLEPCTERYKKVIWKFFQDYKDELAKHFEYEECTVFPYILSVLNNASDPSFSIIQYEDNHTNIEEKLGDLKNIVMKYLPSECDDKLVNEILYAIYSLGEDLRKHTSIEDDVLVPAVNRLEREACGTNKEG